MAFFSMSQRACGFSFCVRWGRARAALTLLTHSLTHSLTHFVVHDSGCLSLQSIWQVMEVVENLPKRVVQPYRSMSIQQLIECDDVPPDELVGVEAIHKHLKIYKSLFKTFLKENKDILKRSPTNGVVAAPSKARFGAYSIAEMKKFVDRALKQPDGWQKWITLLLAYARARRSEIAKLEKLQIKYAEDCQRYYFLIAEGG
ncbi:hypothetical protein PEC301653_24890 [Pectobacterium carotovorum subsp. carotovorum]|nr:hypothetical protein PCC21_030210 [Pectobacterium carotovorum subsp. carotovorum PCC21]GKV99443.1 hypothetical protein PEC301653_24890 [Pectobacterium carotovorum subsp. carotovorum]